MTLGNSPGLDEQIVNEKFFFEKFAARVESSICGEIERARSKWQKLLKTGAIGRDARNWCEFARIEIDNDEHEKARKIYHQGVHFATENLDEIYENARDFELLYGSVEQVDELELKIEKKKENILKKAEREAIEKEKAQKRARNDRAKVEKKGWFQSFFRVRTRKWTVYPDVAVKGPSTLSLFDRPVINMTIYYRTFGPPTLDPLF